MRVSPSFARISLLTKFCDLRSTMKTLQFVVFRESELSSMWSWALIGMSFLLKYLIFICPSYFSFLSFSFRSMPSVVWILMKLRADPVSASQLRFSRFQMLLYDFFYMRSHIVYFCVFDVFEVSCNEFFFVPNLN